MGKYKIERRENKDREREADRTTGKHRDNTLENEDNIRYRDRPKMIQRKREKE